jgi:tRNA(Ile)-lysidine synthase TilS/MesJ
MKAKARDAEYDCIIGVSGGVDSTMVAYLAKKKLGLRPLAVHLDNGWNSELAVNNVERALKMLDIDLYTYVLDWEEFRDLQLSFLKASVTNCEIPTDHAINALLYRIASEKKISYILSGSNVLSEGIYLPPTWGIRRQGLETH